MKKFLFALLLLVFSFQTFSQIDKNLVHSKGFYLQKSKNKNTIGWILLGGGTAMIVVGAITFSDNWDYGSYTATDISGFVLLGGLVADIVSIPFFVSAHKNKVKAASVAITNQNILLPEQKTFAFKTQPALKLKIELR